MIPVHNDPQKRLKTLYYPCQSSILWFHFGLVYI